MIKGYIESILLNETEVRIANAIMGEPDIIVLDEPINALDEESVQNIKQILIKLKEKGKLLIIACHDREELSSYAISSMR